MKKCQYEKMLSAISCKLICNIDGKKELNRVSDSIGIGNVRFVMGEYFFYQ